MPEPAPVPASAEPQTRRFISTKLKDMQRSIPMATTAILFERAVYEGSNQSCPVFEAAKPSRAASSSMQPKLKQAARSSRQPKLKQAARTSMQPKQKKKRDANKVKHVIQRRQKEIKNPADYRPRYSFESGSSRTATKPSRLPPEIFL